MSEEQSQLPRIWLEKTLIKGSPDRQNPNFALGCALLSPARSQGGHDRYRTMREAAIGDTVLHLVDNDSIVALSRVTASACSMRRNGEEWYLVKLGGPRLLKPPLSRTSIFSEPWGPELRALVDAGLRNTFFTRQLKLQQGQYLTAVPDPLLEVLEKAYFQASKQSILQIASTL